MRRGADRGGRSCPEVGPQFQFSNPLRDVRIVHWLTGSLEHFDDRVTPTQVAHVPVLASHVSEVDCPEWYSLFARAARAVSSPALWLGPAGHGPDDRRDPPRRPSGGL